MLDSARGRAAIVSRRSALAAAFAIAAGLVGLLLYEWVSVYRFRLEITVERNGRSYSGASEYVVYWWHRPSWSTERYRPQFWGDAVVIRTEDDVLFALTRGRGLSFFDVSRIPDYLASSYIAEPLGAARFALRAGHLPALVRFRDPADPNTVEAVLATHLWHDLPVSNAYFVQGRIEVLPRPILPFWSWRREQIRAMLPWLREGDVNLLGGRPRLPAAALAEGIPASAFVSDGE